MNVFTFNQTVENFNQFLSQNNPFPESPEGLYQPCNYFLGIGGKRIRPVLCLMGYQLFHDEIAKDVYNTALAWELFHNFTLLHDDIMDNSDLRRGKPTVHIKYGNTAAILSGDVMNIIAYQSLEKINDNQHLASVLRLFNRTAIEVCEGQQYDMDFEQVENVAEKDYLKMIGLKTSVLLAACLKSAGILANASENDCDLLYQFGLNLGLAFQIQDDYLDTFGKEETIGKVPGGDIWANKKTILLTKLFAHSDIQEQKETLKNALQLTDRNAKVEAIKNLYYQYKIDEYALQLVKNYSTKSLESLQAISVSDERKVELINLSNYLINRNH